MVRDTCSPKAEATLWGHHALERMQLGAHVMQPPRLTLFLSPGDGRWIAVLMGYAASPEGFRLLPAEKCEFMEGCFRADPHLFRANASTAADWIYCDNTVWRIQAEKGRDTS